LALFVEGYITYCKPLVCPYSKTKSLGKPKIEDCSCHVQLKTSLAGITKTKKILFAHSVAQMTTSKHNQQLQVQ